MSLLGLETVIDSLPFLLKGALKTVEVVVLALFFGSSPDFGEG